MRISLSNAWEETRTILGRDGRLLVSVALALLVLPGIVLDVSMPAEAAAGVLPPAGPWVAIGAVALALSMAGQLAIIRLALGAGTSVSEAIAHGFKRLLPYLGALCVWLLPLVVLGVLLYQAAGVGTDTPRGGPAAGFLVLALIGLFLLIRLSFLSPVASAEPVGPIDILKRAWALGGGNWWRLFVFAMLFGITIIVVLGAVQSVVGTAAAAAFGGLKPWSVGTLLVSLVGQVISSAIYVVFFVMLAQLYRQAAGEPKSGT